MENGCHSSAISAVPYNVPLNRYMRARLNVSYGVRHAGCSEQLKRSSSDPANVPLSKPGETNGFSGCRVTSAAVTSRTLVTALCEKKAPLCGRERQSIVGLFGEPARGSKILTAQLWQQSKQSHNVQWQEQVVIVSRSEKKCGLQCDIVRNNRSFNTTSFLKPRPAQHSRFLLWR